MWTGREMSTGPFAVSKKGCDPMACLTCRQTSASVSTSTLSGLQISSSLPWYQKGSGSALVISTATMTNVSAHRVLVLASSKSLQREMGFSVLPGEKVTLLDPGPSGWEVFAQQESQVQRFGAGIDLVGLGLLAAAAYGGYAAIRDMSRARRNTHGR